MGHDLFGEAWIKFQSVTALAVLFVANRSHVGTLLIRLVTAATAERFSLLGTGQIGIEVKSMVELQLGQVDQLGALIESDANWSDLLRMVDANGKLWVIGAEVLDVSGKGRWALGAVHEVSVTAGTQVCFAGDERSLATAMFEMAACAVWEKGLIRVMDRPGMAGLARLVRYAAPDALMAGFTVVVKQTVSSGELAGREQRPAVAAE